MKYIILGRWRVHEKKIRACKEKLFLLPNFIFRRPTITLQPCTGLHYVNLLLLIFIRTNQFYDAAYHLQECLRLDRNHPYATNNLAYIHILLGNNKEALYKCLEADKVNVIAHNYYCNWAIALLNQKMYSEGVDVIKRAIEEDDTNPSI